MAKILNNLFTAKIMSTETMTLRDLRVQTFKERKEGRLTKIPDTFYKRLKILEIQIRKIVEESKENIQRLEKANADVRKFSDMKLELHKNRERKLTDLAREKVNGQNPNMENVHQNENEYLISLCKIIEKHRANTLLDDMPIDTGTPVPEKKGIEPKKKTKKNEPQNEEYIEIKVLEDLPTFTGMDAKNYSLKSNDIVSIPIYNARMLSDAGKVRLVKEVEA
jgi:DNA replication initiation complex subunit (GINS family)